MLLLGVMRLPLGAWLTLEQALMIIIVERAHAREKPGSWASVKARRACLASLLIDLYRIHNLFAHGTTPAVSYSVSLSPLALWLGILLLGLGGLLLVSVIAGCSIGPLFSGGPFRVSAEV